MIGHGLVFSRSNKIQPEPESASVPVLYNREQTTPALPPPYRPSRRERVPANTYKLNRARERGLRFQREENKRLQREFIMANPASDWEPTIIFQPVIYETSERPISRDVDFVNNSGRYEMMDRDPDIEEIINPFDIKEVRGSGLLIRDFGKFPPKMRNNLKKFGDEEIKTITIFRYPLKEVSAAAKFFSGDRVPYDQLFHLGIHINGKYILDKSTSWNFEKASLPKGEHKKVPVYRKLTINELLERTQKAIGKERFYTYKALSWNCQDAVQQLMKTAGGMDKETLKFIKQDMNIVKKNLPSFSQSLLDILNKGKEIYERQVEGEGHRNIIKYDDFDIYY